MSCLMFVWVYAMWACSFCIPSHHSRVYKVHHTHKLTAKIIVLKSIEEELCEFQGCGENFTPAGGRKELEDDECLLLQPRRREVCLLNVIQTLIFTSGYKLCVCVIVRVKLPVN